MREVSIIGLNTLIGDLLAGSLIGNVVSGAPGTIPDIVNEQLSGALYPLVIAGASGVSPDILTEQLSGMLFPLTISSSRGYVFAILGGTLNSTTFDPTPTLVFETLSGALTVMIAVPPLLNLRLGGALAIGTGIVSNLAQFASGLEVIYAPSNVPNPTPHAIGAVQHLAGIDKAITVTTAKEIDAPTNIAVMVTTAKAIENPTTIIKAVTVTTTKLVA